MVAEPNMIANRPQIGARIVIPGKMNRKENPKVQTLCFGLPMWTRKISVRRISSEKTKEYITNHLFKVPAPGGLPWFFKSNSQIL